MASGGQKSNGVALTGSSSGDTITTQDKITNTCLGPRLQAFLLKSIYKSGYITSLL